ncbi:hypothetical protein [Polaromonas naphthalenivorans]|uniref:hypothetical protein n=1 Tax=Polaromonas naphthalenivorans TaxID=216465 RepID=UPI00059C03D9|nr:hypothetical protein [Polaromonas naphthalenivorans]
MEYGSSARYTCTFSYLFHSKQKPRNSSATPHPAIRAWACGASPGHTRHAQRPPHRMALLLLQ